MKVDKPDLNEDIERLAAVRKLIGPEAALMVDANYALTVEQSIKAARAFKDYNIVWFEVSTNPDDCEGYRQIAEATGVPLRHRRKFAHSVRVRTRILPGKPIVHPARRTNCGGNTGFLRVVESS